MAQNNPVPNFNHRADRQTRRMYFLTFSHDSLLLNKNHIIEKELPDYESEDEAYMRLRTVIMDKARHHKSEMVNNTKTHVTEMIEDNRVVKSCQDAQVLVEHFPEKCAKENFFAVFRFMEGYLDFDTSTDLGKWYMNEIYANLCMRIMLHLDWLENGMNGFTFCGVQYTGD